MKILKNKTYKDLLLKIDVLESDKVKLQKKCDEIQNELNLSEQNSIILSDNLKNKTDYISSLNERLQKAEAERDTFKRGFESSQEALTIACDKVVKLQQKLSRKGLGTKGSKKGNNKQ